MITFIRLGTAPIPLENANAEKSLHRRTVIPAIMDILAILIVCLVNVICRAQMVIIAKQPMVIVPVK